MRKSLPITTRMKVQIEGTVKMIVWFPSVKGSVVRVESSLTLIFEISHRSCKLDATQTLRYKQSEPSN